jgi:hypothetical protein
MDQDDEGQQHETIELWVRNYCQENGYFAAEQEQIDVKNPQPRLPEQLQGWQIYYTSDNGDCMIHAILIDISPTFRKLNPVQKDTVAHSFRRTKFLELVTNYYLSPPEGITRSLYNNNVPRRLLETDEEKRTFLNNFIGNEASDIDSYRWLRQEFLAPICLHYKFKCLLYQTGNSSSKQFLFEPENDADFMSLEQNSCIVIHNSRSVHFEAMSKILGEGEEKFYMEDEQVRHLKQAMVYEEGSFTPARIICDFYEGAIIEGSSEQYNGFQVIDRLFEGDPPTCTSLKLQNPASQNEQTEFIPIRTIFPNRYPPLRSSSSSSSSSSSFSPSFGEPLRGRAGSLDAFPDDDTKLNLETELKVIELEQKAKPQTDPTLDALNQLQKTAEAKLKKLEFVQWFFESGVPLDCENLKKGKLNANINKRLGEFAELGLLDKLYEGIFFKIDKKRKSGEESPQAVDVDPKAKKEQLLSFFTDKSEESEMVELCKLAKLDLVLNNVSKFNEVARQPKYDGLFDESGKFIQPPQDAKLWKKLLEELQKRFKFTRANVSTLLPYLVGSNALLAYRRAARFNSSDIQRGPFPDFPNLAPTKWLREVLTAYGLPGFPIQIAIDFEREDISDAFVKDIPEDAEKAALKEDYSFLNGKEFVKNMVTNRSIPSTFKLAPAFAGDELTQKLVNSPDGDYFETQKIPFLDENAAVFISREITEEVDNFERLDKNPEDFDKMPLSQVSVPIFIIFSCLKRKKLSRTKIWQNLMTKEGKPKTPEDQAEIDKFMELLTDKNLLYEKNKKGEFIFEAFHTSIIILCNGKIYTMGYGSDPFYDAQQASAENGDTKIKYLKKMEGVIKNITGLQNVQILGTGFIYSPDSLNIEDEGLNYRIVDAGILKKSNIVRLNKILATVKQTRAITMVVDDANDAGETVNKLVTVEQLSCQTMCVYSRLATRYTQGLPFASQLMNCSSFVELAFPERINCSAALGGYSDPNACLSKTFGKDVPIGEIFDLYFAPGTTIGAFKNKVGYDSDVPLSVRLFNKVLKRVATVSTPWFRGNKKAGVPSNSSTNQEPSIAMEEGGALKLKKRKKQKRPKNTTARKSSNK